MKLIKNCDVPGDERSNALAVLFEHDKSLLFMNIYEYDSYLNRSLMNTALNKMCPVISCCFRPMHNLDFLLLENLTLPLYFSYTF